MGLLEIFFPFSLYLLVPQLNKHLFCVRIIKGPRDSIFSEFSTRNSAPNIIANIYGVPLEYLSKPRAGCFTGHIALPNSDSWLEPAPELFH